MSPQLNDALGLAAGMAMLLVGGQLLVRGSVALASRLGVSTLLIGLTIVSWGTSAPELFLNVTAAMSERAGLSFGNLVGANIANIGLILGIGALIRPIAIDSRVVRNELPITLGFMVLMALAGIVAYPAGGPALARLDGVLLLLAFGGYAGYTIGVGLKDRAIDQPLAKETQAATKEDRHLSLGLALALIAGGILLLKFGGDLAVNGAVAIATRLGISNDIIGLTVISVGTTLPELVTTIAAQRKGQTDIAVGNALGSCIFNAGCIFGTVITISPMQLPEGGVIALVVMVTLVLLLFPLSTSFRGRIVRAEGLLLLVVYLGFIGFQVWRALNAHEPVTSATEAGMVLPR